MVMMMMMVISFDRDKGLDEHVFFCNRRGGNNTPNGQGRDGTAGGRLLETLKK